MMFVASLDHSLYAFSPASPTPVWRHRTDTPLRHEPAYHNGVVYCAVDGTGLVAFDARGFNGNAKELWTSPGVIGTVVGMRKGRLLVWTGTEGILIDPADGSIVDRATLSKVNMLKTDAFVDGNLYAVSEDGVVVKLLPKN
jgi:outer membrane protein assembly factor BamB